jgi:hypothetical protein
VGELTTGKELKRLEVITAILRSLSKFSLANRYFKDLTRMDTTTEVTDKKDMILISNVRNVGILT